MLDGVIDGYDGLSPVDSLSIYRLYNMLERGQWVYSLSPKGPAPTQGGLTTHKHLMFKHVSNQNSQ
jgi:hypothetical protein